MQNFKQFLKENELQDITITDEDLVNGKLTKQYPDIKANFYCYKTDITSLEFVPQSVGRDFSCFGTKITTLEFAPQYVGRDCSCSNTKITSLKGIGKNYLKEVRGTIYLNFCTRLESNMLGLLLVKGLRFIEFSNNKPIKYIFNNHLDGERDILECQEELITKGFKEYAKL